MICRPPVSRFYYFEILGTTVFAISGVLAVTRRGLDVFGALVLGVVTALGGGTVRDVIIRAPVFWIDDFNYVWAAGAGRWPRSGSARSSGARTAACFISMRLARPCSR